MPVGHWSGGSAGSGDWEDWDDQRVVSRDVSPDAFMEELSSAAGGYGGLFRTLAWHYYGWWMGVVAVPALFLDHHRCEVSLPYGAWLLYGSTVLAMVAMSVLLELSVVQRLGLLRAGELWDVWTERHWRVPLLGTLLWKLDSYTDVAFIFIARDCGSSLWWASLATFTFEVLFGQLLLNFCFACTDCDRQLPSSFGFMVLDFKLVNNAVRQALPFDPDQSHLPVARPMTLRTTGHLISVEKGIGNIAQVSIQSLFLLNSKVPHGFVHFSVVIGALHGALSLCMVLRECVQDEVSLQAHGIQQGTALLPGSALMGSGMQLQVLISPTEQAPVNGGNSSGGTAVAPTIMGYSATTESDTKPLSMAAEKDGRTRSSVSSVGGRLEDLDLL